jgi:ATP-binding cassette, subfamily B, bacterial
VVHPSHSRTTIHLDAVAFAYPSRTEPSLQEISLAIEPGEVIALVGHNGSGKTTLAKLIAGLYEPTAGAVRWGDTPIGGAELPRVRATVAIIFQDFARYFLSGAENIAVGRPERIDDRVAIEAAAERAGALSALASLPDGLDSPLGPEFFGGNDLSLGQWQRVALARAFFRDAPVLILDEPTAALDARAEHELFTRVSELYRGRTVVLISHRLSSVRSADRILVLDQGRLVEQGDHASLMASDGQYAELFRLQASGYVA